MEEEPRNPIINTSGSGTSQLTTSFSPSLANANDSKEEHVSLKVILELLDHIFSVPVEVELRYKTLLDYLHTTSYGKNHKNFVLVKEFFLRFADVLKPYNSLTYHPEVIVELQEKMFEEFQILVEKDNVEITCTVTKAADKSLIPNQLAVPAGKKEKQPRATSSLTKGKRAKIDIPLETLLLHSDKTLEQVAKAIGVSESKVKDAVKGYEFYSWTHFKFQSKKDLSEKATHSSLTTSSHGGNVGNTSGLPVVNPPDQYKNLPMPVVPQAANVNHSASAYLVNDTTSSLQHEMSLDQIPAYGGTNHQVFFQPQNITNPPETSVSLSRDAHGFFHRSDLGHSILAERANQFFLTTNLHGGDVSNTFGFPVLNESNQHNLPMTLQAGNVNHSAALSSLRPDEMLMQLPQVYGGTNDLLRYQPRNQFVTTSLPETTMQEDRAAVIVKATYGETNIMFELFSWSKMEDLNREVTKRLDLEVESFQLKYLDVEGDLILIRCDADLKVCMDTLRTLGWTTVKMLVSPTTIDPNDFLNFDMSMG